MSIGEGEGVLSHFVCALLYTCFNFSSPSHPPLHFFFFVKKKVLRAAKLGRKGEPIKWCLHDVFTAVGTEAGNFGHSWLVRSSASDVFLFLSPFFFVLFFGVELTGLERRQTLYRYRYTQIYIFNHR